MYFVLKCTYLNEATITYYQPFLLLKDGSIKKNPVLPPESLDVIRSKQESPDDWGSWEMEANATAVTWSNGSKEKWDSWYFGMPESEGEKLDGNYLSQFAFTSHYYEAIEFNRKGAIFTF